MYHQQVEVLTREEIAPQVISLRLFSTEIAKLAQPGQFVHVKCGVGRSFILRRPLSIHRVLANNTFEIIFKVYGQGTRSLSTVGHRDFIDVLGPLGQGFRLFEGTKSALLIAGGLGIAPLYFLAEDLAAKQVKIYFLQGAETKQELIKYMELKRFSRQLFVSTVDGSTGYKGQVTDLLEEVIDKVRPDQVFACGPNEMLKRTANICLARHVACQVSIERRMACGIGACLSCTCQTTSGYKLVCKDGPVFEANELIWD
jgi:dihydroorotate dehydrogenase electron transfer subunit